MKYYLWFVGCIISAGISAAETTLTEKMQRLDTDLFNAFNLCADEQQLAIHASYFSADVEFYHDNGGVTWDRDSMIANTKKHACGNYTRQLDKESFRAHPIKNFGAITEGVHTFCQSKIEYASDKNKNDKKLCDGKADFVMVWRQNDGKWQVTRVLSYGHRENK